MTTDDEGKTELAPAAPQARRAPEKDLDAASVAHALAEAAPREPSRSRWWRDARRRRLLALADCAAVAVALLSGVPPERAIWLLAFLPVWILLAKLAGLYDADHRAMRHLTVDEAPAIVAWGVVGTVTASLLGGLTPAGTLDTGELAIVASVAILADFALRVAARAAWRASTEREQVLIVGEGGLAHAMRHKLALFSDLHMTAVEPGEGARHIDRVVLAQERIDAGEVAAIRDLCRRHEAKLSLVSPLRGQATPQQISRLGELPVLEYVTADVSRSTMLLKRCLDLIVGVPLALLAAPLLPLISHRDLAGGQGAGAVRAAARGASRRALPPAQVPDHAGRRRALARRAAGRASRAYVQAPP